VARLDALDLAAAGLTEGVRDRARHAAVPTPPPGEDAYNPRRQFVATIQSSKSLSSQDLARKHNGLVCTHCSPSAQVPPRDQRS